MGGSAPYRSQNFAEANASQRTASAGIEVVICFLDESVELTNFDIVLQLPVPSLCLIFLKRFCELLQVASREISYGLLKFLRPARSLNAANAILRCVKGQKPTLGDDVDRIPCSEC